MSSIDSCIHAIREKLNPHVTLIAVSKTFSYKKIIEAWKAGVCEFGENYLEEALEKQQQIKAVKEEVQVQAQIQDQINWHYLGRIQTKKIPKLVLNFDFIHTVASLKHVSKIHDVAASNGLKQNILLQIKHDKDPRDYGISFQDLEKFLVQCFQYNNIHLAGLMYLAPLDFKDEELVESFQEVEKVFKQMRRVCENTGHSWNMLSMGMSTDYHLAQRFGATHVRLGRAVFGARNV